MSIQKMSQMFIAVFLVVKKMEEIQISTDEGIYQMWPIHKVEY